MGPRCARTLRRAGFGARLVWRRIWSRRVARCIVNRAAASSSQLSLRSSPKIARHGSQTTAHRQKRHAMTPQSLYRSPRPPVAIFVLHDRLGVDAWEPNLAPRRRSEPTLALRRLYRPGRSRSRGRRSTSAPSCGASRDRSKSPRWFAS